MVNQSKPVVLLLLNGFGYSLDKEYNAVAMANTPCCEQLQKDWLMALRRCSGNAILCNYANCDMVGRNGIMDASILAVEAVDASLRRIVDFLKSVAGQMIDKEHGQPHTVHTINPVPLLHAGGDKPLDAGGNLPDLATILAMLGIEQPVETMGRSFIKVV